MARRRRSRSIEIFNFSFLDILACTIGLLIFIMVMVFILQAGSPMADTEAVVRRQTASAVVDLVAADRDTAISDGLEVQLAEIPLIRNEAISEKWEVAKAERDAAKALLAQKSRDAEIAQAQLDTARKLSLETLLRNARQKLNAAQARVEAAKIALAAIKAQPTDGRVTFLPRQREGDGDVGTFQVLHMDCRAEKVVLLAMNADGSLHEVTESATESLGDSESAFAVAINRHRGLPRPMVLFWVRPDGMGTFNKAVAALPPELARGFEPADAGWRFGVAGH